MRKERRWLIALVAGMVLLSLSGARAGENEIRLLRGNFDPLANLPDIPSPYSYGKDLYLPQAYFILQFKDLIDQQSRNFLTDQQIRIYGYIPEKAFLVKLSQTQKKELEASDKIRWIGLYEPYFKVNPFMEQELVKAEGKEYEILIALFADEDAATTIATIQNTDGVVALTKKGIDNTFIKAIYHPARLLKALPQLAKIQAVEWIERYPEAHLCNDDTAWVVQSGLYAGHATPLYDRGIYGQGQIVCVLDTGCDADMCYFYDQSQGLPGETVNMNQRKIIAYHDNLGTANWDQVGHGTHTAGTVAGDNFATPGLRNPGDGIAIRAKLVIQDYGIPGDLTIPDSMYEAFQESYDDGARIHSNSWGDPYTHGQYPAMNKEVDRFVWDNPDFLPVFAAGNEGTSGVRAPGTAKNVVTCAATQHGSSAENIAWFSSWGPTNDSRQKPDVALCGENIISASNDYQINTFNCTTEDMSGTSMATPGIAGASALVRQYFTDGFYPNGFAVPAFSFTPSAALLKAILINSAENMTGDYTGGAIPARGQGWGRLNLDNALYFDGDQRKLWLEDSYLSKGGLQTGQTHTYYVGLPSGNLPLKITLVWSDYPAEPSSSVYLVNDLDLEVVIGGQTYLGNVFSGGHSIPGGSADRRNNVECVLVENPSVGACEIRVKGYNVPMGPQNYALVVTGDLSFSAGRIIFDKSSYNCSAVMNVLVSDWDLKSTGSVNVHIKSTSDQVGFDLTLIEDPADSGVFKGTVQLTSFSPQPGQLLVADGDTITGTYIDADDGQGGHNVLVTTTALVDCTPPIITEVGVLSRTENSAQIFWRTDEPSSSVVHYGIGNVNQHLYSNDRLVTEHSVLLSDLNMCTEYLFKVSSTDYAGNTASNDNNGNFYLFTTLIRIFIYQENMDSNPGWTVNDAQWAWGQPSGGGGSWGDPDPTSGYTGNYVFGYNLNGDYSNNMSETWAKTPAINLSNSVGTVVSFYRWLGVESSNYDHAKFQLSRDGVNFITIWENGSSMSDGAWVKCQYDISAYADYQQSIYLRWTMGPTDGSVVYCGWNIDDVKISYITTCNEPNLVFIGYEVDDSAGNNNGQIDLNEVITLPIKLKNFGVNAQNLVAEITTGDPLIKIFNPTVSFGSIGNGEMGISQAPHFKFKFKPGALDQQSASFMMHWTSAKFEGYIQFSLKVNAPKLVIRELVMTDNGDSDGAADPGEEIALNIRLENIGHNASISPQGQISTTTPLVNILNGTSTFSNINPQGIGDTQPPLFRFNSSPAIPDPTEAQFNLLVQDQSGYTELIPFNIKISTVLYRQFYYWNMDQDPGWEATGAWEWGVPAGMGGSSGCPDPTRGVNGPNVYGYNLRGDYPNNLPERYLTTQNIDMTDIYDAELKFYRWLGVESPSWDHAKLQISNTPGSWVTIWENSSSIADCNWTAQFFNISAYADNKPAIKLRWVMGPTDSSVTYCGWNIDEVSIAGKKYGTIPPTFTPSITPTPTATPTPTITPTPTLTFTPTNTFTPTDTATPIFTSTPTLTPTSSIPTDTPTLIPTSTPTSTLVPTLTPTSTPTSPSPQRPLILVGGYFDTRLYKDQGGRLLLVVLLTDNQVEQVEIYAYGQPTGIFLFDDGAHGDFGAGDGVWGISLNLMPVGYPVRFPAEVIASKIGITSYPFPYLTVE